MVIGVSACLLGENCKYNGGNNYSEKTIKFLKGHEVVPVCPEVLGGLPTPRKPAEIVDGVVKRKDGCSVDTEFRGGVNKALKMPNYIGYYLIYIMKNSLLGALKIFLR